MLYLNQKDNCMKEFVNRIVTLDNIKQWEERDSVIKETVSQHSFKVSAICIYIFYAFFVKNAIFFSDMLLFLEIMLNKRFRCCAILQLFGCWNAFTGGKKE